MAVAVSGPYLARLLGECGFDDVHVRLLAGTIVALHTGAAR